MPPGIHAARWREVEARLGGIPWRNALLLGLQEALESLQWAGCRTAYVNGSFASTKAVPADYDACWEPAGVDFGAVDPALLDFTDGRRAQKERFRGEFFPSDMVLEPAGIRMLDFFQREQHSGKLKGIIEIDLETSL